MKKLGTYTYKRYLGQAQHRSGRTNPVFELLTLRVEIVDETQRKYRVKYLGFHASGEQPGGLHWVGKDKVKLDEVRLLTGIVGDTTNHAAPSSRIDFDNIRLPYKDHDDDL